ncbi:RIP metalloprotease RseP [Enterocloster citroniae]|uniref:RIP metalloprotease RseP n=1 Tax=Enterocloster citroniae TaxID=358743 RepID=UPI001D0677AE|nr:RIP metalloprotease RseP [Enterocloster citroniae]MCB7064170.1 RIP metalloprotease RseP [Enterocloster citroniae]
MSLIIAVLMLGIIIMIHEFGHFLFAKLNGIGVIEFSLGMGPRLISFEKGGTRYSFKILPFGGSCMMLGEDENEADEHAFNNKSVWARISVVAAGPIFNFLLAFLLSMALIGATGYDTTQLNGVLDGYPAQAAGMQAGDVIQSINGRRVHSYRDINMYLFTHPQKQVEVTWSRTDPSGAKQTYSAELAPAYSQENDQYMIGVQFDPAPRQVEHVGQLLLHGLYEVQYWIHYVFDTFYMMFHGLVSLNDISGPVGIVTVIDSSVDEASSYGVSAVVLMLMQLTILLSANLGVMNLLPIPALDGGRLVFLIIEAVRGKPIDKEKEGMVHMAGMVVLLALMVLILFNDVRKLF